MAHAPQFTAFALCAEWCGVCRDFHAAWDSAAADVPHARFVWVDIEDEADRVDDIDVETFPTVAILRDGGPHFFGVVLPNANALKRLLEPERGAQHVDERERRWLNVLAALAEDR